jgi:hypothetical protein
MNRQDYKEVPHDQFFKWCKKRGAAHIINNCYEPALVEAVKDGEVIAFGRMEESGTRYFLPKSWLHRLLTK